MKIAFLAAASSIHSQRWVGALAKRGHDVTLFTQHPSDGDLAVDGLRTVRLPWDGNLGYFANAWRLRRELAAFKPDVLNAHYASGYGTTSALAQYSPTLLSVWGSDVYDFPREAAWKLWLVRRNLSRATAIASTSEAMAVRVRELLPTACHLFVTPFGVDCDQFSPMPARDPGCITVGTVKTLAPKYGIDVLLRAFAQLLSRRRMHEEKRLRLVVVGGGEQRVELAHLAEQLGVADAVEFIGPVAHQEVPVWLNRFDIFVAASRLDSESFGVAAVEAGACGIPCVVSDAGGLPEVVRDGETGLVFPREDAAALSMALERLVLDAPTRERMGQRARAVVLERYEWNRCVDMMESAYEATIRACKVGA